MYRTQLRIALVPWRARVLSALAVALRITCLLISLDTLPREATLQAQATVPLQNHDDKLAIGNLETEVIDLRSRQASPSEIQRPAGKFIILLVLPSSSEETSYQVDKSAVGDGVLASEPQLRLVRQDSSSNDKVAGILDAPAGQYQLKAASTAHVLCTINLQ